MSARALARSARLTIVSVAEWGVVRQDGALLFIGTGASDNAIATAGCRRKLALAGLCDERLVQRLVEQHGYQYVPEEWAQYAVAN